MFEIFYFAQEKFNLTCFFIILLENLSLKVLTDYWLATVESLQTSSQLQLLNVEIGHTTCTILLRTE